MSSWVIGFLGGVVLAMDQFLKLQFYLQLPQGGVAMRTYWRGIELMITHVGNQGAAWGWFAQYPLALFVLRLAIVLTLLLYLALSRMPPLRRVAFTLILAGAIGNVCDCVLYGHVVDLFLCVFWGYHYPVFNVADMAIVLGVVLLLASRKRAHANLASASL